ncbi:hypothetical protein Ahy_B10g105097 [Arachis hypogaea]|uniref:Uncharacterized protein n=1 Tax=Arachis hypogaea TaxID=3818 RepID=A0A444X785_ARAHY|nr:hypothetical protein Ahy_B10g105097 [Arachis hypogaea]
MKRKHNISGQSILKELRKQTEDINLSSEDGLEQISLNDDGDEFLEMEMLNQSGIDLPEPAIPKNKRDEIEPLLVKFDLMFFHEFKHLYRRNHHSQDNSDSSLGLEKSEKVMMELDADGQGRDNGLNLFVRFLGQKQCLQNAKNREKLLVSHADGSKSNARRATPMEKKLGRPVCRSEVIVSTLLKKNGNYVSGEGQRLAVFIQKSWLKRVCSFSNATCPSSFGKSKCIFGVANFEDSSSASQSHVTDLERQLQEAKDQVTTLHRFLR